MGVQESGLQGVLRDNGFRGGEVPTGEAGTVELEGVGGARGSTEFLVRANRPKKKRPTLAALRALNRPSEHELEVAPKVDSVRPNPFVRTLQSCILIIEKNTLMVAIRVRPLNEREVKAGGEECVELHSATRLTLKGTSEKSFGFDCIFGNESSQQDIFDRTALPLLGKVLLGYNGCLFAYGQTASGKTYTMQGVEQSEELMGIIPRLCGRLFEEIAARHSTKNITVYMSYMEIYNEHLSDLLVKGATKEPTIKEDSASGGRGIFVEGVSEVLVESPSTMLKLIAEGARNRSVGRTNMNEFSSRSHAVVTLRVTTSDIVGTAASVQTSSKLHLIDLAGSERQKSTGACGERLKEGAQINLSLSALGNVINALTEPGGKTKRHIPYRDSKLTRLLQDSLGGNSYTVMICNCSPAAINSDETLCTLRFAERAKKVENVAFVNQDPMTAKITELSNETKYLKAQLSRLQGHIARLEEHYE